MPFLLGVLGTPGRVAAAPPVRAASIAVPTPEQQLAAKYAPIADLKRQTAPCDDVGEPYAPAPVDVVLGDAAVVLRRNAGARDAAGDPVVKRAPTAQDLAGQGSDAYLDLPGAPRDPGCAYERFFKARMGTQPPLVYAHVATESGHEGIALQYWFFYVFNRFNNLHEGDWEMIQLTFAAPTAAAALEQAPTAVAFAQHGGGETAAWDDSKLQKDGDHPIVFPAAGSHAAYYGSHIYLGWGERGSGLGCDDSTGPSVRVPLRAVPVPDHPDVSGTFAWLTYPGLWGEKESSLFSGPTGPNMKRQWTQPFTWQDHLRKNSLTLPSTARTIGPNPTGFFCQAVAAGAGLITLHKHDAWLTYGLGALLLLLPLLLVVLSRDLLGAALTLFARHAGTFLALGAVLVVLGTAANLLENAVRAVAFGDVLFEALSVVSPSQFLVEGGSTLQAFVGWTLVMPAVIFAVGEIEAGRRPRVRDAGRSALRGFLTLLKAAARAAVIWFLLVVGVVGIPWAVVKTVRWFFLAQAIVLDGADWRAAHRVSERRVRGRWWRTAILSLVVALVVSFLAPLAGIVVLIFVTPSVLVADTVSGVVYALLFPVAGITTTLWYRRRPSRRLAPAATNRWGIGTRLRRAVPPVEAD